jgi:HEAT repeat protein
VGLIFYGIFGLGLVALSLFLAASGAFSWEGALVCVIFVGVGIMLFMNGLSGIRSRQIYARHGLFTQEYRGSTAVMIGWGQIAAGAIPVLAIPLVLFFQADWGKAFGRGGGPEFAQPGAGPNPLPGQFPGRQPQPRPGQNPFPPVPQPPHAGSAGPSIDKLLDDLNSPVAFTRRQAVEELARMTPNERRAEVAIALRTKLDPHDHFQVQSVLKALDIWGDDRDVPAIMNLLDSQNPFIRREAMSALGKRKAAAAATPIADRLRDLSDRQYAASALRSIGAAAERPTLELLNDSDPRVREEALKVLRDIATRASIPALREAVNDEDRTVSGIARSILLNLGDTPSAPSTNPGRPRPRPGEPSTGGGMNTDLTKLIEDVNGFDTNKRRAACESLQSMQPAEDRREEVALALNKALEDSNPLTRRAAVRALGAWATKENVPGLITLLEDRDSFVRTAVFETLAKLKDERSIDPIAKRLENIFDRPQASKALQEMGPLAEATVLLGLRSRDPQTRQEVCRILKVIGTKESVATLNQFVVAANRSGDRATAALADEAVKAINEREKGGKN